MFALTQQYYKLFNLLGNHYGLCNHSITATIACKMYDTIEVPKWEQPSWIQISITSNKLRTLVEYLCNRCCCSLCVVRQVDNADELLGSQKLGCKAHVTEILWGLYYVVKPQLFGNYYVPIYRVARQGYAHPKNAHNSIRHYEQSLLQDLPCNREKQIKYSMHFTIVFFWLT